MKHSQSFSRGVVQDVDAHLQPENSYRAAAGMRLLYNPDDSDPTMSHGMAISNAPGNRYASQVPQGYTWLGEVDCSKGTLLFSTNGTTSCIQLYYWDTPGQPAKVVVLYSDEFDPNLRAGGLRPTANPSASLASCDRLLWTTSMVHDGFKFAVRKENESVERVYWTDRIHCVHTLNLNDCFNPQGYTYHSFLDQYTPYYPKHLSVHAFRERADVVFPRIKPLGRCIGRLLSGVYQIAIQYRHKNGHESVWSPLTRRVFVTTNPLDDPNAERQAALRANHHNRVMAPSGQMSTEGLRFEIDGIDQRWERYRLAIVYYQSPDKAYKRLAMRSQLITDGRITVDITQLEGDELTDAALQQRYDNPLSVGTLATDENLLVTGNLTFLPPIEIDTSAVRMEPTLWPIDADQTRTPQFTSRSNPVSNRNDGDPITNVTASTLAFTLQAFTGQLINYSVTNDFNTYKGQVVESIMRGYFRGETYEFGALLLDRSGQPLFVTPLPSFTFPEQYAPGPNGEADYYSLTKYNPITTRYDLQVLGLRLSGLALPVEQLYDQDGRLNVSGLMIVRQKRRATIQHQGVVVPVCVTADCWDKQKRDYVMYPLLSHDNGFNLNSVGDDRYQNGPRGGECTRGDGGPDFGPAVTQPYFLTYHSPDVLIRDKFDEPDSADGLKHVGIVRDGYTTDTTELVGEQAHVYNKCYNTATTFPRLADLVLHGRPRLGDSTRISLSVLHNLGFDETYKEFDKDYLKLMYETQTHVLGRKKRDGIVTNPRTDGLLQRGSVLMKVRDWKAVDVSVDEPSRIDQYQAAYRVVNYTKPVTTAPADKVPYFSTGQYLPITQAVLDKVQQRFDVNNKLTHYVFNGIDVLGGDCFVNPWDFTRLYPFWSDGCETSGGVYPDYAVSMVVPIESQYNLALRWGRSFAANATKPQSTSCDNTNLQFMNGITSQQPEDWKYNEVLDLEEGIQFYAAKDPEQTLISQRPSSFQWAGPKLAGQRVDSWRNRLVGDIGDADGACGPITELVSGSFSNVYVLQTRGIGAAPLNPIAYQSSEAGLVQISSNVVFQKMVYLSRESGTQHPSSVWVSKGQMGCWDARNGLLLRHSQAGLDEISKVENINDLVKSVSLGMGAATDATVKSWRAAAGVNENGDVYTTIHNGVQGKTLVYSPAINAYVETGLPVYPLRYGRRGPYLLASPIEEPHKIYVYQGAKRGEYFGQVLDSSLTFIVNPSPGVNKRFDNLALNINKGGIAAIKRVRCWTPNGGPTQVHTIEGTDNRIEYFDNMYWLPLHEMDWESVKEPCRDHYLVVELTVDNRANVGLELLNVNTVFLPA